MGKILAEMRKRHVPVARGDVQAKRRRVVEEWKVGP
jgi:hypothetical protein